MIVRNRVPRSRLRAAAVFVGFTVAAFAPSAAWASKGVVGFFGSSGTGNGQFSTPRGAAVDPATGNLYVVDSGHSRVEEFSVASSPGLATQGSYVSQFGAPGAGAGQLNAPQGVAVGSGGTVFVTDQTNRRVDVFSSAGAFEGAFGWGVVTGNTSSSGLDFCTTATGCQAGFSGSNPGQFGSSIGYPATDPASGAAYVPDPGNRRVQEFSVTLAGGAVSGVALVRAFGSAGSGPGQFGSGSPTRVAVDSTGAVYAVDIGNSRVQKFDSAGNPVAIFASAALSGSPSPTDVAVDPTDNHVFVVKPCNATICPSATLTSERHVLEFDSVGSLIDTHAVSAGVTSVLGLAYDPASGNIYLSGVPNDTADGITQGAFVLNAPPVAPTTAIAPASSITGTGATLNATVNPTGFSTGYHFEYSTDDASWTKLPAQDVTAGSGTSDVPVSQNAGGLEPSQLYHVRAVATKPFGAGSATSTETTFTTQPLAPVVASTQVQAVGSTEATLVAQIDPENQATTYHFEYGTTTGYGTSLPAADADAGAGTDPISVSQSATGLSPGTTYHYRIVATNPTGTSDGPDHTFTTYGNPTQPTCPNAEFRTGYSATLPDCRAYEQVTPVNKDGAQPYLTANGTPKAEQASVTGDRFAWFTPSPIPGSPSYGSFYLASRSSTGWSSASQVPPQSTSGYNPECAVQDGPYAYTPDLSSELLVDGGGQDVGASTDCGHDDPDLVAGEPQGVQNVFAHPVGGDYRLLSQNPLAGPPADALLCGYTPDFGHVVFQAYAQLTSDAPANSLNLYDWSNGALHFIAGAVGFPGAIDWCAARPDTSTVGIAGHVDANLVHSVAAGGADSSVFYYDPSTRDLEVFKDDNAQVEVDASQGPGASGGGVFRIASTDGQGVLFTDASKLTPDATAASNSPDLYRYDLGTGTLTDLTVDHADPSGADVQGVVGASDDLSYVYFVADGVLAPGASAGQPNLYLLHNGSASFIATLDGANTQGNPDPCDWTLNVGHCNVRAPVSPDGSLLAFESDKPLTGYDNTDPSGSCGFDPFFNTSGQANTGFGAGCPEVYLYDAGTGGLVCASCSPTRATATAAGMLPPALQSDYGDFVGAQGVSMLGNDPQIAPRSLTEAPGGGGRVFFDSAQALAPGAADGTVQVYEYEQDGTGGCATSGGCIYLVSSGQGGSPSTFLGASQTGDDAFFLTADQLAPTDTDGALDVYDARVDGGFPYSPPAPPCSGDGCKPPPGTAPAPPLAATVAFSGPGNASSPASPPAGRVRVLTRAVHGDAFLIRVNVPGRGRIAITGAGIRTVGRSVSRAGTYSLRVTLTASDKRRLARRHRLKLKLRVSYAQPGAAARTVVVPLTVERALPHSSRRARRATSATRRAGQ